MLDTSKIDIKVTCAELSNAKQEASVQIDIKDDLKAADILNYMRSGSFKSDLVTRWANKNAPGYGVNFTGGPEPVFKRDRDRSSGVVGYRQALSLVKWD